jgi:hypothetical protein
MAFIGVPQRFQTAISSASLRRVRRAHGAVHRFGLAQPAFQGFTVVAPRQTGFRRAQARQQ